MSIKRQGNYFGGIRFDIPHARSIESGVANDFDTLINGLVTQGRTYIARGFKIVIPSGAVTANNLAIKVSSSAVFAPSASESGSILVTPDSEPNLILNPVLSSKVSGSFQPNTENFVSLDYVRTVDENTVDQVAGWSESQKIEYERLAPIARVLDYKIIISTTGFGNFAPLYIIKTDINNVVLSITNCKNHMFRLATGGTVPNPTYSYSSEKLTKEWINPDSGQTTNPVAIEQNSFTGNEDAFEYGDWSIESLKSWMDVVMTRIKEITGSEYWYTDSALSGKKFSLKNVWWDSIGSVLTGNGSIFYNTVLDTINLSGAYGAFQSQTTDPSISIGDSYVIGKDSKTKATLSAFSGRQLIINSPTQDYFNSTTQEVLYNRRIWRFNGITHELVEHDDSGTKYAILRPKFGAGVTTISGISVALNELVVDTTSNHGYVVGDVVSIAGATATSNAPNGVYVVKSVNSPTSFTVTVGFIPTGAIGVTLATTGKVTSSYLPFATSYAVSSATYNLSLNQVELVLPNHNYSNGDVILVTGLTGTDAPNGAFAVFGVTGNKVYYTPSVAPSGAIGVTGARAYLDELNTIGTITKSSPEIYNKADIGMTMPDPVNLIYVIGSDGLGPIPPASGDIQFDVVVARTNVADPVKISSIVPSGTGFATVTTYNDHNIISSISEVTFYGNPQNVQYAKSYSGVTITPLTTTTFKIEGGNFVEDGTYSDASGATDDLYLYSPNNPYAGPIHWDSDIILKGIIGDRAYTIAKDAIIDPSSSPEADKFSNIGIDGVAYLQDGEVMYAIMERDQLASNGELYECSSVDGRIHGTGAILDTSGSPLIVGDFIKFIDESETKWFKIGSISSGMYQLIDDSGRSVSPGVTGQRPPKKGKLVYTKGTINKVYVKKHYLVEESPDILWLAVRRDNGSFRSKVYFKGLELEMGEARQINDNEPSNLLVYTGAGNEAATVPNYTVIDKTGIYKEIENLIVQSVDIDTKMVTFSQNSELGIQKNDVFTADFAGTPKTFIVNSVLTTRTVIVDQDPAGLVGKTVEYHKLNYKINDSDNLTLALRKEDKELGAINTAITRPIYDESMFVQKINISGAGTVKSGSYIYKGSQSNPTALAWVLHGNASVSETIEGAPQTMPGGHVSVGSSAILVHIVSGSFTNGDALYQNGVNTGVTISDTFAPDFLAPPIKGGMSHDGVEIVLPPNRRTQQVGTSYVTFPSHSVYKTGSDASLAGEDLFVIINDMPREANIDYEETFGGPKAKIRIIRDLPANTRVRTRLMSSYGSVVVSKSGSLTLQDAYNSGNIIDTIVGRPVDIRAGDSNKNEAALKVSGSIQVDGGTDAAGGIIGTADKSFVVGTATKKPKEVWSAKNIIKSHTNFADSEFVQITSAVTTVNDIPIAMVGTGVTIPFNSVVRINAVLTARGAGNTGSASFRVEGCFKRGASGDVVAVGSPSTIIVGADGDGVNYAAAFDSFDFDPVPDGIEESVAILLYGHTNNVFWSATMDYQIVKDNL